VEYFLCNVKVRRYSLISDVLKAESAPDGLLQMQSANSLDLEVFDEGRRSVGCSGRDDCIGRARAAGVISWFSSQ